MIDVIFYSVFLCVAVYKIWSFFQPFLIAVCAHYGGD